MRIVQKSPDGRIPGSKYTFDADMRFMRGRYVGRDGRRRWGSFGFI